MSNVEFLSFIFSVCVSRTLNLYFSEIIINITSSDHLFFACRFEDLRLFELFIKTVRVKKRPGMSKIVQTHAWLTHKTLTMWYLKRLLSKVRENTNPIDF